MQPVVVDDASREAGHRGSAPGIRRRAAGDGVVVRGRARDRCRGVGRAHARSRCRPPRRSSSWSGWSPWSDTTARHRPHRVGAEQRLAPPVWRRRWLRWHLRGRANDASSQGGGVAAAAPATSRVRPWQPVRPGSVAGRDRAGGLHDRGRSSCSTPTACEPEARAAGAATDLGTLTDEVTLHWKGQAAWRWCSSTRRPSRTSWSSPTPRARCST